MDADLAGATGVGGMPAFPPPAVPGVTRRGRGLAGAGGWAVAAQDFGFVPVPGGGGAVGVADQGPAHPVDHDVMVIPAQQDAVLQAGLSSAALVPQVVDLTRRGGLVAAAGPLAELVPQLDRVADRGRDIVAVPDIQGQARAGQAGAELLAAQEAGQPAWARDQGDSLADDGAFESLAAEPGRGGQQDLEDRRGTRVQGSRVGGGRGLPLVVVGAIGAAI